MTMTAYEIAKKAARMARRGFDVGIRMDMSPCNVGILVADEDGTRGLSVPEDEAAWTAARWIDGAELPIKDENDE